MFTFRRPSTGMLLVSGLGVGRESLLIGAPQPLQKESLGSSRLPHLVQVGCASWISILSSQFGVSLHPTSLVAAWCAGVPLNPEVAAETVVFLLCRDRIPAMFRIGPLRARQSFSRAWSGALPAMHPATSIWHSRTLAMCSSSCLSATTRGGDGIAGLATVFRKQRRVAWGS